MNDIERLQEHALARQRLLGSFLHGSSWREHTERNPARPVLAGFVLSALVCAGLAGGHYVTDQLHQQRQQRAAQLQPVAGMSDSSAKPPTGGRQKQAGTGASDA